MGGEVAGSINNRSSTTGVAKAGAAVAGLGADTVAVERAPGSGDSFSGAGGVTGRGAASGSTGLNGDGGGNDRGLFFSWQGLAAPGAAVSGAAVSGAVFMPGSGSKQQVQGGVAAVRGDSSKGGSDAAGVAGPGCLRVEAGDWGQQGSGRRGSSGVWSPQGAYETQGDGSTGSTCSGGSGRGGFSWGRGGFSVWEEEEMGVERRERGGNALESQKEETPAAAPGTGTAGPINTLVGDGVVDTRQGRVGDVGVAPAGAVVGGGRRCEDSKREGGDGDASSLQYGCSESGAVGPAGWMSGGAGAGGQAGSGKGGEKGGGEVGVGVPGAVRTSADAAKGLKSAAVGAAAVGGAAVLGACDPDGGNGAIPGREGNRSELGVSSPSITGSSGDRAAGSSGATARAEFRREVMAMVSCGQRCPQLLRFYGVCVDVRRRMCIVTKLMPGGTLHDLLRRRNGVGLPLPQLLRVAMDIALGMRFLHRHGITPLPLPHSLHFPYPPSSPLTHHPVLQPTLLSSTPLTPLPFSSDLKTANVLLDEHGRAVVGDFGVARLVGDGAEMTKEVGTYRWMAPEAFGTTGHWSVTPRSDVYSFGIVLWELLTARLPYEGYSPLQAAVAVALNGLRPAIPAGCPEGLRRLIEACWARDPAERPDSEDVVRVVRGLRRELLGEESVEDEEETSGGDGEQVVSGRE
ncbi:unnamed protein product [Closterium sp. Naga37s-1]|nr:unnamed protein product [Closterium sp. Naga37s-1]